MKNVYLPILGVLLLVGCGEPKQSAPVTTTTLAPVPQAKVEDVPWQELFDGKTLGGWKTVGPGDWSVHDGEIWGRGNTSHLFGPEIYTNLEFKAEVKLNHSGNSGMYFRAEMNPGWPNGYEAQCENSSPDPTRTGSLYHFTSITNQLIPDDTWWTQHVIAISNRIIIKINDKITTDGIDKDNTYVSGHLAFQQHNDGSEVEFRNVMVKRLPTDPEAAMTIARKDMPDIRK